MTTRPGPLPGISTEKMHMFLAEYAAASRVGAGGGLAEENEEIEVEPVQKVPMKL